MLAAQSPAEVITKIDMASVPAPLISNEREIQPMQLSIEQLNFIKTQHEEDIIELNKQLEVLMGAKNRYLTAKATITEVGAAPEGNSMLVPLTSSLYVPGTITDKEKLLVELGTGYFAEKTIPEAKELIERKVYRNFLLFLLFSLTYFLTFTPPINLSSSCTPVGTSR
jgi:prefoldin alpha subunit